MKVKELEEGFLDNVMAKIQTMAGGDGITGFIRSLQGSNARLDLVVDTIANQVNRLIKSGGQTNLGTGRTDGDKVEPGGEILEQIPLNKIIMAAFTVAANLSKTGSDIGEVTRDQLITHLKSHQRDILAGVNVHAKQQWRAGDVVKLIMTYITSKTAPDQIKGLSQEGHVDAVSTVAAVTLLDWEFREMVGMGTGLDAPDEFKFDDASIDAFVKNGNKINAALFTPGSDLHTSLEANNEFKENMQRLILDIIQNVQKKYVNLPTAQLQALVGKPVNLIDVNKMQASLVGHLDLAKKPPEYRTAITNFVKTNTRSLNTFIGKWIALAASERSARGEDSSDVAFGHLHSWAKEAMGLLDSFRPSNKPNPKDKPKPGEPAPAGTDEERRHQAAHNAAAAASARLPRISGETDEAYAARRGQEYENAMKAYFDSHPSP